MAEDKNGEQKSDSREGARKARKQASPPTLKIVLDTNQLFTGSASDLLQMTLRQLIEDSRRHADIRIEWHLPDTVRWEREFQMTDAARELLPGLAKLERLLGHSLGISAEILESRVQDAIQRQTKELELHALKLSVDTVDWPRLIGDAIFRRPPFERGKSEKGFRDALIAESFLQLIESSPRSPKSCRVALVSNDKVLGEMLAERTKRYENVRILKSLEEIQDLINTLVSNVTEEFVASIRDIATKYFLSVDDKEGLFYSANIRTTIQQKHVDKLNELPPSATTRENGTWYIANPAFAEKHGQRVTWVTTIKVETTAYKEEPDEEFRFASTAEGSVHSLGPLKLSDLVNVRSPVLVSSFTPRNQISYTTDILGDTSEQQTLFMPQFQKTTRKILVTKGRSVFHVKWSVTVTANKKLLTPKVEEITAGDTQWD